MKIKLFIIALLLTLSGCGSKQYIIKEASTYGSAGSDTAIIITDKRPNDDKAFSYGSMMVFNSNYGIWTLGDEQFSPNLVELLKIKLHKSFSMYPVQPRSVSITLERMIIQSNHQADLLQSVSTGGSLGPLGVLIAETMHGKVFELDYDKTRPFVMGLIKAKIKTTDASEAIIQEEILVSKIENFSNHMDVKGRELAAISVARKLMDNFVDTLKANTANH